MNTVTSSFQKEQWSKNGNMMCLCVAFTNNLKDQLKSYLSCKPFCPNLNFFIVKNVDFSLRGVGVCTLFPYFQPIVGGPKHFCGFVMTEGEGPGSPIYHICTHSAYIHAQTKSFTVLAVNYFLTILVPYGFMMIIFGVN